VPAIFGYESGTVSTSCLWWSSSISSALLGRTPHQVPLQSHRDYGSLTYWQARYTVAEVAQPNEEQTDEWFIAWCHLAPVISPHISKGASVIDLGCGTSGFSFDLLSSHLSCEGKVLAVDAAGAIVEMEAQKARLVRSGSTSAGRSSFLCADATQLKLSSSQSFDVSMDKGTTDAMLCDMTNGAARCKAMYAAVASTFGLREAACAVIVSWRDPQEDGLDWLVDLVLGGLQEGSACSSIVLLDTSTNPAISSLTARQTRKRAHGASRRGEDAGERAPWSWQVDMHSSEVGANGEHPPTVYVIRRTARRLMHRRTVARSAALTAAADGESLVLRQHVYEC
jgi:SAM-dependent methyltransferase